ncbi:mRNA capping enzyme-domain-containing protein [Boletus edulis BED1]|uniref:mRNA cap guanine-N(7) methyltransferase n=1 Tax=Boletus edulis BED1 TaxID=1328754 RepID=A0AAD4C5D6_BOLED|nr:mRNA capping enzyme-domain-containing protein [Boletus edulis BED1]
MPAFDPVRDAALNSPVSQPKPLPSHAHDADLDRHERHSFDVPSPSSSRPSSSRATNSPTVARRATDLAVLLNSEPQEPRTPSSARPSSLSHLLLGTDTQSPVSLLPPTTALNGDVDRLVGAPSLRRRSNLPVLDMSRTDAPPEDGQSQSQHFSRLPPPPSSRAPFHGKQQAESASSSAPRALPTSPFTRSPVRASSRPSSSADTLTVAAPMPPPPSAIPYNPRSRKTPASSVLVPMTPQEMELYRYYRGAGTQLLLSKRKRDRSSSPDNNLPAKRHAGDVGKVIDHYNMRPEVGVKQRMESPIIGLKYFNNWVKSVLITRFAHPALASSLVSQSSGPGRGRGKVLDLGCGKGGDFTKWAKARVKELVCADIADVSITQARERWQTMPTPRFDAAFAAIDCYTEPLSKAFPPERLAQPFDVVSMQFCMHYAFESSQKARCMLRNVSQHLRKGGVFLDNAALRERLDALPPSATDHSFGNAVYRIRFEDRQSRPLFGHRYYFFLKDAVEDVPEYIVDWDNFVGLAADYSLYPIFKEEFHQIFTEHSEQEEFKELLVRMKVVNANGESAMDEEQWEAANIYIGFAFEKR